MSESDCNTGFAGSTSLTAAGTAGVPNQRVSRQVRPKRVDIITASHIAQASPRARKHLPLVLGSMFRSVTASSVTLLLLAFSSATYVSAQGREAFTSCRALLYRTPIEVLRLEVAFAVDARAHRRRFAEEAVRIRYR